MPCAIRAGSRRVRPLAAFAAFLPLAACERAGVLDPQGPVGAAERLILFDATGIMLVVVAPVILLTLGFAWWFRASNSRATFRPDWAYSGQIELVVWSIPAMVVLLLAGVGWISSHELDPPKPLVTPGDAPDVKPLRVQVVSLDWKWLFLYPDLGLASINELTVPAGTPIAFELTSATVMNAFFVPQLGSMIYTMPGMTTRLNLMADRPGEYPGLSAHFSGDGFSDMRFLVHALPADAFAAWAERTRGSQGPALDEAAYGHLMHESTIAEPATLRGAAPELFQRILDEAAPHGPAPPPPESASGRTSPPTQPTHPSEAH